jgi:thiamine-monophosphate kinase
VRPTEKEIIGQIRNRCPAAAADLLRGIGDDCAVIRRGGELVELVTTDTLVEGVHFDPAWHPPELLGRKAAAVNLSDIAAMGGRPRYAFLSLGLPADYRPEWLNSFLAGFLARLEAAGTVLAGGDTVCSPRGIVLAVTVLGEAAAGRVLLRSGAGVGDLVMVSGPLGEAAAGLELCRRGLNAGAAATGWQPLLQAHLDPEPELALGAILAGSALVSAMMDLSDGLATDLAQLCRESGVGAELEGDALPQSDLLRQAAALLRVEPRPWSLAGGEDYRLLFTVAAARAGELAGLVRRELGRELYRVGRITAGSGVFLTDRQGRREITDLGYDHFRADGVR